MGRWLLMYKSGKLAFLTGKGTAGLGKCGSLSHLESLFDSDTKPSALDIEST